MFFSFPARDVVRTRLAFGPYQHDYFVVQQTQTYESLFAVVLPRILACQHGCVKYHIGKRQVDAVFAQIDLAFRFVVSHNLIVHTIKLARAERFWLEEWCMNALSRSHLKIVSTPVNPYKRSRAISPLAKNPTSGMSPRCSRIKRISAPCSPNMLGPRPTQA